MSDVKVIQKERIQLFQDVHSGIVPKRVPVNFDLPFEPIAQLGGLDLIETQWNPILIEEAADSICQRVYSDVSIFRGSLRFPSFYQALNSQSFVVASNGLIQHPEVVGLLEEEYDFLIEKPHECIMERVIPRQYRALNFKEDPVNAAITLTKSMLAYNSDNSVSSQISARLIEKYGYYPGSPAGSNGFTQAPFDLLADQLRGFKGISRDMRRIPEKVSDACEALYPIALKKGMPKVISKYGRVFIPLHMPTYIREKDFAKLWWPTFKRMLDEYASMGVLCRIYCENDWTRYLDYLRELPTDTTIMFEYGDPKLIKDKLGDKFIITGLYPLMNLTTKSKDANISETKRYIDILAPGGKYIFSFDKGALLMDDINMENLCAVVETVRNFGIYTNSGASAGVVFNQSDYIMKPSPAFESKYFGTWERYKKSFPKVPHHAEQRLQVYEEGIFDYLMFLLL